MMKTHSFRATWMAALALCTVFGSSAFALDLTVTNVDVVQSVQYGTTKLFGNNATWVRVRISSNGGGAISGVDASLRMTINGDPQPLPPIFSINGPITAQVSPNLANINDTINFVVVPPVSNSVMFTVEVNPNRNPVETNYANNTMSVTKVFECRKMLECAYVPINYTANGAGLPADNLIEPGVGDGFLRGIYRTEWNYHKSPLPTLTWSQNINNTSSQLQNTLLDIRNNQLPANGQPKPNFVYGWLPGNPYSGNGQANGIPGDVAFGNTDPTRHQRTFAHELGHCLGRAHINNLINTAGVDVEHHLKDTQNLPQIKASNLNCVMVAGLLTHQAWVWQTTFDAVHNDARMQCGAPPPDIDETGVLRISGVIDHQTGNVQLDPVMPIERAMPTANDPNGDTTVTAFDVAGNEIASVTVATGTTRELCSAPVRGRVELSPASSLYVMIPQPQQDQAIHSIKVIDRATGRVAAEMNRSANAPHNAIQAVEPVEAADGQSRIKVTWSSVDADADAVTHTLLYSHDAGASWVPLVVNTTEQIFEYKASDVAVPQDEARYKLISSDGMNAVETEFTRQVNALDGGEGPGAPATYLISPNTGSTFPQHAPIAFHGTSWDNEDKLLTGGQVTWTSSIDGPIGAGMLFMHRSLSPGTHTITVTGTDTASNSTSRNIAITITPRTVISADCNANGVLDSVDITNGTSADANGNGIPDECETLCAADITGDNVVNVNDLLAVINAWGPCAKTPCAGDITGDGLINVNDLLAVINAWGPCP